VCGELECDDILYDYVNEYICYECYEDLDENVRECFNRRRDDIYNRYYYTDP
jgi:hypothetical protein